MILSIILPVCFGMIGTILVNMDNKPLVIYLLLTELLLLISATYLSLYLSKHVNILRKCLIRMESGEEINPYNVLEKIRLFHNLEIDIFDKLLIGIGVLLQVSFYIYLVFTL